MAIELVDIKAKKRGPHAGGETITYKGISRAVTNDKGETTHTHEGVLSTLEDALSLPLVGNDLQKVLDWFAREYNRHARSEAGEADLFGKYVETFRESVWSALNSDAFEKKMDTFKRAVRAHYKAMSEFDEDLTVEKVAEEFASKILSTVTA